MLEGGLFITLFDHETLSLYVSKGVYATHMEPVMGTVPKYSRHHHTLADYACGRRGTHVFFFIKRKIVYGGQLVGPDDIGAFYLNGAGSPMGRNASADLVWDESNRSIYEKCEEPTHPPGTFTRNMEENVRRVCQPYMLLFKDSLQLAGRYITSDRLYFELGEYSYPLPSNSISDMSFCTLTPGETAIALRLLRDGGDGEIDISSVESVELKGFPTPFKPEYGVARTSETTSEAHLEASILSNPRLLPEDIRPRKGTVICRQVPISPFKPSQMDRADICFYSEPGLFDATIPDTVIELKKGRAGKGDLDQVMRYEKWLEKRLGSEAAKIKLYLLAPEFTRTISIPHEYRDRIFLRSLDGLAV